MLKYFLVAVAGYGVLIVTVYLMQGRMLYLPDVLGRTMTMTPMDIGMDYQDVSIETADGVTLHGWFIVGRSSQVLLFFHGNAGNISHRSGLDTAIPKAGFVSIHYRLSGLRSERRQDHRNGNLSRC